jgi:hypothetical protein
MNLLKEVGAELAAMFIGDARLAAGILALIAGTAALVDLARLGPLPAGAILLFGSVLILFDSVRRAAASERSKQ